MAHAAFGSLTFLLGIMQYAGFPAAENHTVKILYMVLGGILTVIGFFYQRCVLFKPKQNNDDEFKAAETVIGTNAKSNWAATK